MLRAFFATVAFLAVTTQAVNIDALDIKKLSDASSPAHDAFVKFGGKTAKPAAAPAPEPESFVKKEVARINAIEAAKKK